MPVEKTVIDLLYHREKYLSKLYAEYADKYSEYAPFWRALAEEEKQHARVVELYSSTSTHSQESIKISQRVFDDLQESVNDCLGIIEAGVKKDTSLSFERALKITHSFEYWADENLDALSQEMVEPRLKSICSFLATETKGHKERVLALAQSEGITLHTPALTLKELREKGIHVPPENHREEINSPFIITSSPTFSRDFKASQTTMQRVSMVINAPILDLVTGEDYGVMAQRLRKENAELSKGIKVLHEAIGILGSASLFPALEREDDELLDNE